MMRAVRRNKARLMALVKSLLSMSYVGTLPGFPSRSGGFSADLISIKTKQGSKTGEI